MNIGRSNIAALARARRFAGMLTALGLAVLMVAFLTTTPASAASDDQPAISAGYSCGLNRTWIPWTASSGGGLDTPDDSVSVQIQFDNGTTTEIGRGEFNSGNGYSFDGRYRVPRADEEFNAIVIVTTEQGFENGAGIGATAQTAEFFVPICKDGTTSTGANTTTTTSPTTTTTQPTGQSAVATAVCEVTGTVSSYPIEVTVTGDPGATGTVTINGTDIAYTIDADGSITVSTLGVEGTNTVVVTDDVGGVLLDTTFDLEDCTNTTTTTVPATTTTAPATTTTTTQPPTTTTTIQPTTTTVPPTTTQPTTPPPPPAGDSATVVAVCEVTGNAPSYPIDVTVSGDPGATGTVTINGTDIAYTIDADGSITVSTLGVEGTNTVQVTDDSSGDLLDETLVLENCETTPPSSVVATTLATTTTHTHPPTETTGDASSQGGSTTDVSVLGAQVSQDELPRTGLDNAGLILGGAFLVAAGAGLLIVSKRKVDPQDA